MIQTLIHVYGESSLVVNRAADPVGVVPDPDQTLEEFPGSGSDLIKFNFNIFWHDILMYIQWYISIKVQFSMDFKFGCSDQFCIRIRPFLRIRILIIHNTRIRIRNPGRNDTSFTCLTILLFKLYLANNLYRATEFTSAFQKVKLAFNLLVSGV